MWADPEVLARVGHPPYFLSRQMSDVLQLLDRIVSEWRVVATIAVVEAVTENPDANYYAAGFWLFYVDYTVFGSPCLGLNTEANLAESDPTCRWCPPEWLVDVHPSGEKLQPLYAELSELLDGKSDAAWETAIEQHYNGMCVLCRILTEDYHAPEGGFGTIRKNPQFVFGIFEERAGDDLYEALVSASIEPERRAALEGL